MHRRFVRRIPSAEYVTPHHLGGKRVVRGIVTRCDNPLPLRSWGCAEQDGSVGDADNFRLYHKPLLHYRTTPTTKAALKDETLHIRLAGVDAPELAHFGHPAQPYSAEALDHLTKLVLGKTVDVRLYSKDRYGRVVGMAHVRTLPWPFRKRNVSEEMLRAGLATVYTAGGAEYGGMKARFDALQEEAQASLKSRLLAATAGFVVRTRLMSSTSKATKEARSREFVDITGASSNDALRFLKASSWRLEPALDAFYNDPSACRAAELLQQQTNGGAVGKNLEKLWERYQDPKNPAESDFDGTTLYCEDLQIEPSDVVMLALAWLLKAPTMPRFSKKGFVEGWKPIGKDTVDLQRAYLSRLRSEMRDPETFRKIYNFTFDYMKTEGQKSLQLDIASELWNTLIPLDPDSPFSPHHLEMWQQFLVKRGSKAVSRDTWNLFLEFTRTIDPNFEQYDEEAAWPSIIDDFVSDVREGK
ncbi:hypothetical protein MNV49_001014 [Pseudohyphozyma bogoriensis]|nr:hypothetical protein MNV49_001014 [Pseudohyphozyma bogoriensis]